MPGSRDVVLYESFKAPLYGEDARGIPQLVSRVVSSLRKGQMRCRRSLCKSAEIGARREANRSQVGVPGEDLRQSMAPILGIFCAAN